MRRSWVLSSVLRHADAKTRGPLYHVRLGFGVTSHHVTGYFPGALGVIAINMGLVAGTVVQDLLGC